MQIESYSAPIGLHGRVLASVRTARRRSAKRRSWYYGIASVASLSILVVALGKTAASLANTSFLHYAPLIFTDTDAILASWKEFSLLIVESLPLVAIAASLTAALAFFWLFAQAARNVSRVLLVPNI